MQEEILVINVFSALKRIIKLLVSKRWIILLIALVGGILGASLVYFSKPQFTAKVTFFCDNDNGGKLGGYASIAQQFGIDLGLGNEGAFNGENLLTLMRSHNLLEKTFLSKSDSNPKSKVLLIDDYFRIHNIKKVYRRGGKEYFTANTKFVDIDDQRLKDTLVNSLIDLVNKDGSFSVDKVDRKVDMLYVAVKESDEVYAKKFAETLVANVLDFYFNYKTKKSRANVAIIKHQADSVREKLFGGISNIAEMNDLNVNPLKQQVKAPAQVKQAEQQVNTILYAELIKNLQIAELTLKKETPLIQIVDKPNLPLKNEKIGRIVGAFGGATFAVLLASIFICIKFFYKSRFK